VLAAEHLLDLAGLHFLIERFERQAELGVNGLAGLRPLDEDGQVLAPLPERRDEIAVQLETPAALLNLLGFSLVFPEVGRGDARLDTGQFFLRAGDLKDSSADRRRAC
jgi:hypothetical protein